MKKSVKKRISPQQEGLLIKVILALLLAAVLWIVFSPGAGLVSLSGHHSDLEQLEQEIAELEKENHDLQVEIDRLQNDPEYLEEIARKEYGLLRKNERVYEFSVKSPQKKK
jgi:cell division protein FtsB